MNKGEPKQLEQYGIFTPQEAAWLREADLAAQRVYVASFAETLAAEVPLGQMIAPGPNGSVGWSDAVAEASRKSVAAVLSQYGTELSATADTTSSPHALTAWRRLKAADSRLWDKQLIEDMVGNHEAAIRIGVTHAVDKTCRRAQFEKGDLDALSLLPFRSPESTIGMVHSLIELGIDASRQEATNLAQLAHYGRTIAYVGNDTRQKDGQPMSVPNPAIPNAAEVDIQTYKSIVLRALQSSAERGNIARADAIEDLVANGYPGNPSLRAIRAGIDAASPLSQHRILDVSRRALEALELAKLTRAQLLTGAGIIGVAANIVLAPSAAATTAPSADRFSPTHIPVSLFTHQPNSSVQVITVHNSPHMPVGAGGTIVAGGTTQPPVSQRPAVVQMPSVTESPLAGVESKSPQPTAAPAETIQKPLGAMTPAERIAELAIKVGVTAAAQAEADKGSDGNVAPALATINLALHTAITDQIKQLSDRANTSGVSADVVTKNLTILTKVQGFLLNPLSFDKLSDADRKAILSGTGTGFEKLLAGQTIAILKNFTPEILAKGGLNETQLKLVAALLASADLNLKSPQEIANMLNALPKESAPAQTSPQKPDPKAPTTPAPTETAPSPVGSIQKALESMQNGEDKYLGTQARLAKKLLDRGLEYNIAIGFVANMRDENSSFNPAQLQGGKGPAAGLIQWEGPRLERLKEFATSRGVAWDTEDIQLDFIMEEIKDGGQNWGKFKDAPTPEDAASGILRWYERAADKMPGGKNDTDRRVFAVELHAKIQKEVARLAAKPFVVQPKDEKPAPLTDPGPVPAEGVKNPTKPSECAEGSISLGFFDVKGGGKAQLCALLNLPSRSEESTPGSPFYIPNSNGRAIVAAEFSANLVAMIQAAKEEAGIDLTANSSFRTFAHQKYLCDNDPSGRCQKGNHKYIASEKGSEHSAGSAIDFGGFTKSNSSANCVMEDDVCTPGENDKLYEWLSKNSMRFGFYQYSAEFWHFDARDLPSRVGSPSWKK